MNRSEEAVLIKESMKKALIEWLKLFPLIWKEPVRAHREMSRIRRHAKSHLHRAIELERGIEE